MNEIKLEIDEVVLDVIKQIENNVLKINMSFVGAFYLWVIETNPSLELYKIVQGMFNKTV